MKTLWTDGSANPNPGPGGFAVLENGEPVRLGKEKNSSNIRMEGAALIAAMEYAGEEGAEIITDSQFWVNVLEKLAEGWEGRGWTKKNGEINNLAMDKKAWGLYRKFPIKRTWTRGHIGTEMNEKADEWANKARKGATVPNEAKSLKG
ncbi:hypothetical protein IJH89_02440, partial [Candidatus Saccharibacteria bacterium]|nr:hypothetical protein [Candidatus Saccharibacteria bacterium]